MKRNLLAGLALLIVAAMPVGAADPESSAFGKGRTEPTSAAPANAVPAAQAEAPKPVAVGVSQGPWDSCLPDANVVEDLKKRQADLDTREKELKNKETDLRAREDALNDEMKKLDQLRKDVSGLKEARKAKTAEQVGKLIEALEKMSAKAAAPLLAKVDEDLAVAAMEGLSTQQLAKILSNMEISRSIRLSELLAMGDSAPVREPAKENKTGGANGAASQP